MDKYEERVSKILEKKKFCDAEKKRKRRLMTQTSCIFLAFTVIISAFVIVQKRIKIDTNPENTTSYSVAESITELNSETASPETTRGSEKTTLKPFVPLPQDCGGDSGDYIDPYTTKYRSLYYSGLSTCYAELVTDEEYFEWIEQYYEKYPTGNGLFHADEEIIEPTRMKIVDFVMYFNIPRESFEEANNTRCHKMIKWGDVPVMNPKDYKEQEEFEVYNVDIIYTFDDEIINAYYERGEYPFDTEEEYLEAVENDGYVTQTEEFIMLEGFEKVTLPALPPDAEPIYIDFDWRSKRCE